MSEGLLDAEKDFAYTRMTEVAKLGDGKSFGELALMMNQK